MTENDQRSFLIWVGKKEGELFLKITPVDRPRNIDKRGKEWSHVGVDIIRVGVRVPSTSGILSYFLSFFNRSN